MTIRINGDNTAANPGITGTDTDTGLQFGTDEVNIVTGGSTQATVDSSGRLLVGTSTGANRNLLQIQGDSDNGAGGVGGISLRRGVALGSIGDGSQLGQLDFCMSDGGVASRIICDAEGSAGTGDYPGRLQFETTADSASSPTERFRISSTGAFGLSGANYGTSGQVLTSQGSGSAPQWADAAGATYGPWTAVGTSQQLDITGIDSSTKKITINFYNWSSNTNSSPRVILGDSGGFETSGYKSTGYYQLAGSGAYQNFTGDFRIPIASPTHSLNGRLVIFKMHDTSNVYIAEAYFGDGNSSMMCGFAGHKQLSSVITQVRVGWTYGASDTGAIRVVQEA
jgi:hypothetical protein